MSNIFDIKCYKVSKTLLCAIGLWPYQEASEYYVRRIVIFLMIFTMGLAMAAALFKADLTIDIFAEFTPMVIILTIALLKYFFWWYDKDKMRILLESIARDWNCVKSEEHYKILHEVNNEGRTYNLRCVQFVYIASFLFNISPYSSVILDVVLPLNQSRPLQHQYKADYYIDPQKHFFPILLHLYLGSTVILTIVLASDLMYVNKLYHACGLFRVAGYQISVALSKRKNEYNFQHPEYTVCEDFVDGVKYHRRAMRFAAGINKFYQWMNFASLLLLVCSISISLFCVASFIDRWNDMFLSLVVAISQIGYIFVLMYPGQRLINDSENVFEETYNSYWYSVPISTQKFMIIVMRKCLTPSTVCAGKLITFSMESYSMIIQTSISYFMALFSLR